MHIKYAQMKIHTIKISDKIPKERIKNIVFSRIKSEDSVLFDGCYYSKYYGSAVD